MPAQNDFLEHIVWESAGLHCHRGTVPFGGIVVELGQIDICIPAGFELALREHAIAVECMEVYDPVVGDAAVSCGRLVNL